MNNEIDVGILELLASKICHDLISPIGAVNNGIEILEEMGPDAGQEVTDLISYSAAQASAKLQAYRMAYGAGGADTGIKPEDVHKAIEGMVSADKKIKQHWDPHAPLGPSERPSGFSKMLISMILLGMECLPKGGAIAVVGEGEDVIVKVAGPDANMRAGFADALSLKLPREKLEPKFMHAYITGVVAREYGFTTSSDETLTDTVTLRFSPPKS